MRTPYEEYAGIREIERAANARAEDPHKTQKFHQFWIPIRFHVSKFFYNYKYRERS